MTDEEMVESLAFDIRFQYALHTTSFEEQPLSDKTLSRFRKRCYTYELTSGIDLIHETIIGLSGEMAKLMKISGQIQRMDSLMVASNIKRLTRMELLYTCLSDFIVYLHKQNDDDKLKGLEHYYDPADYNKVIYRQLAKSKNIEIVTTDLLGKDAKDIYADFQFSEDETRIVRCPAGYQPKSSSLVKSTGNVRASFHKNKC